MPRIAADRTLILSNLGFDARGPYLEFNDVFGKTQHRMPILGRTFSLRLLPHRYCTGSFDLISYRSAACELSAELLLNPDQKDMNMCPHCQELTGFDPAFYNASTISPQQRAYNKTPHFVYMAYFSPQHLKVGISSETRGIDRLLEQGARVCAILKRFENADDARSLEADLCARADTFESMRLSAKVKLLSEYFNPHEAIESLKRRCALLGIEPDGGYLDLTPYYFGEGVACPALVQVPDGEPDDVIGGRCIGLVGGAIVFEQNGSAFVAPVKSWESFETEITVGEMLVEYEPQQMGLW